MKPKSVVASTIADIQMLLNAYYNFSSLFELHEFLLQPIDALDVNGRVVFEEDAESDELNIGIQLGSRLVNEIEKCDHSFQIPLHHLAVLTEEISHFHFLCEAYTRQQAVSELQLETLGEVDRFLILLSYAKPEWKNLHDVCDEVMCGENRFLTNSSLYMRAESEAFRIVKDAFSHCWDNSFFNFQEIDGKAAEKVRQARDKMFGAFVSKRSYTAA